VVLLAGEASSTNRAGHQASETALRIPSVTPHRLGVAPGGIRGHRNEFARIEDASSLKPGKQECMPSRSSTEIGAQGHSDAQEL
jgi:hypothetical protein